ncbi:MAG: SteA domain-containing protein [Nocardioides sp.]
MNFNPDDPTPESDIAPTAPDRGVAAGSPILETFAYDTAEVVRREHRLLVGDGLPLLPSLSRRTAVLVVADNDQTLAQLKRIKRYLNEVKPVIVAVGLAADTLRSRGLKADVVVVGDQVPSAKTLKSVRDLVVLGVTDHPAGRAHHLQTGLDPIAVALLLANTAAPAVIAGVGLPVGLGAHLDAASTGTFLARLSSAQRLVDADALAELYDGRIRPRHVLLALLLATVAVVAAIATTDVGQQWWTDGWIHDGWNWVREQVR